MRLSYTLGRGGIEGGGVRRRETIHRDRAAEPLKPGGFAGVLGASGLVELEQDFRNCVKGGTLRGIRHLREDET